MDISPFDTLLVLFVAERHLKRDITKEEMDDRSLVNLLTDSDYRETTEVLT